MGAMLYWKKYSQYREEWDHDHCEFCGKTFSDYDNNLHEGYVTADNYHWICDICFNDFKDKFQWRVRQDESLANAFIKTGAVAMTNETHTPTREEALRLFKEYNQSESLLKHALAVEAVMRYCARQRGEDEEVWGIIGLIHDLDFERYPQEHCAKTKEILEANHWPPAYIRAVMAHGWGMRTDVEPQTLMEKTLYAIDELTGLVAATALVRPSKSVLDMTAKSVKKKWKDKSFAAGVDRDIITQGAAMLGVSVDDLITDTIMGMRQAAAEIGLQGELNQNT